MKEFPINSRLIKQAWFAKDSSNEIVKLNLFFIYLFNFRLYFRICFDFAHFSFLSAKMAVLIQNIVQNIINAPANKAITLHMQISFPLLIFCDLIASCVNFSQILIFSLSISLTVPYEITLKQRRIIKITCSLFTVSVEKWTALDQ